MTGGIGSGKTMVCRVLEALGYPVFYADQAAKECMHEDMILRREIVALLGEESYLQGEVNRPFIAEKIFDVLAIHFTCFERRSMLWSIQLFSGRMNIGKSNRMLR